MARKKNKLIQYKSATCYLKPFGGMTAGADTKTNDSDIPWF